MKKAILSIFALSTLALSAQAFAFDADYDAIFYENQIGKIEAVMVDSLLVRAERLENELIKKETHFQTNDIIEGKLMASMILMVSTDLKEIRTKIERGAYGVEIDNLGLRLSELENIVAEF